MDQLGEGGEQAAARRSAEVGTALAVWWGPQALGFVREKMLVYLLSAPPAGPSHTQERQYADSNDRKERAREAA